METKNDSFGSLRFQPFSLRQNLINIHPTSASFKIMLDKAKNCTKLCIGQAVEYNKNRLYKIHRPHTFKQGDLVLVSTIKFKNISGPKKLKDSFTGPFVIKKLHGINAVELALTGELERKHPTFPISLIKPCIESEKSKFPIRTNFKVVIPPFEENGKLRIEKILKNKTPRFQSKDVRLFLVRYKNKLSDKDQWLLEKDIPDKLMRS